MNSNSNKIPFFEKNMETTHKVQESIEVLNIYKHTMKYMYYYPINELEMGGVILEKAFEKFTNEEIKLITPNSWGYIYLSGLHVHPNFSNIPLEKFSELEFNYLQENKPDILNIN